MANPQKAKGDAKEREAVEVLRELVPDLVLGHAQRKLGAGRLLDEGDLEVFDDVTIQVKYYPSNVGKSVRESATGARTQSVNARTSLHTGMICIPKARRDSVRWAAATTLWPTGTPPADELAVFSTVSRALAHIRREDIGVPRRRRIALLTYKGTDDVFLAPIEAWLHAYRRALKQNSRGCSEPPAHRADTGPLALVG